VKDVETEFTSSVDFRVVKLVSVVRPMAVLELTKAGAETLVVVVVARAVACRRSSDFLRLAS
jgi:hypothetical protein